MEKMFSVWSVLWLYHEYEASSTQQCQLRSQPVQYDPDEWREEWVIAAEEYKRSAGEELTQCVYIKIETVMSNCKFRQTI
jgi:hypothetical protein